MRCLAGTKIMKIVQIAPLWERVPPEKYGGAELVVSNITEELVKRGHEVTLFATGDSVTKAELKGICPRALYRDSVSWYNNYFEIREIAEAVEFADKEGADIIHNHALFVGVAFSRISPVPIVHTIHRSLHPHVSRVGKRDIVLAYKDANFVSISDTQRTGAPELNFIDTVYNGINLELFDYVAKPKGDYIAFLGRIVDKKGPIEAIKVARATGLKLKIAAKIDRVDEEFYKSEVEPLIDGEQIEYIGEVDHQQRNEFLGNAKCLISPVKWEEPFGLIAPEANACGTPVVAFACGGLTETVVDGQTGFLVAKNNIDKMVAAVKKVDQIDRATCRKHAEDNFTVEKMVDGYEKVYKKVLNQH